MKNVILKTGIIFFLLIFLSLQSLAQNEEVKKVEQKDKVLFAITPYALLASQSTDVGGQKIRQSFNDLSSITNTGFQLIGSIHYKKFSFTYDGTFAELGVNDGNDFLEINATINQNISEFKFGYAIFDQYLKNIENKAIERFRIRLTASAKYWKNDINVKADLISPISGNVTEVLDLTENQEWWDLMVGTDISLQVSPRFFVEIGANIGGFGIGNSSDISHNLIFVNTFKVHKHILVNAGFRSFRYKRTDGEGVDELETVVNVQGPLLGVSFVF